MRITVLGSGSYKSSLSFRIIDLARQLARHGHQVSVIVPAADKYNGFKPDRRPQLEGVRVVQPWQFTTTSALLNLVPYLFTSLLAIFGTRPQLVYLYKPTPITILGLLPKFLLHIPVILDLDDLGSQVMRAEGQAALQVKLVSICERLALRHASAVVVTSTYLEHLVKQAHPAKAVLVLPNGVNLTDYPAVVELPVRPAIYYFGAINRLSLIEPLLRALPALLSSVPNTRVTIIGGGSALEAARQLAGELGVSDRVIFSGWTDRSRARSYTQFGDVAVCYQPDTPTVRAASNMKVFQYMAMGSVPVVSDVGDLGVYVGRGKAGVVVPPDNPAALAASLIELVRDPARRAELARSARITAERDYSWQQLGDKLEHFINDIIHLPKTALPQQPEVNS